MAYSYTEKKRIRKTSASCQRSWYPILAGIQVDSYMQFLQEGIDVNERTHSGLHAAFCSVFLLPLTRVTQH